MDEVAKREIPELSELDKLYSTEKNILNDAKSGIIDRQGNLSPTAANKIANLTNKGREEVLARVKKVVPDIEEQVKILKALEDVERRSESLGLGGLIRIGVGAGLSGGAIGAAASYLLSQPKLIIPILLQYGELKNFKSEVINGILNKVKSGIKLTDSQAKILGESIQWFNTAISVGGREALIRQSQPAQ